MGIDRLKRAVFLTILASTFIAGTRIFLCSAADFYQAAVTDIIKGGYDAVEANVPRSRVINL